MYKGKENHVRFFSFFLLSIILLARTPVIFAGEIPINALVYFSNGMTLTSDDLNTNEGLRQTVQELSNKAVKNYN